MKSEIQELINLIQKSLNLFSERKNLEDLKGRLEELKQYLIIQIFGKTPIKLKLL